MEYIPSIFSLVFLLTAFISIFLGLYIIKLNSKSNINKSFLFLCISLSVWSLGFSFANSAEGLNESIFWRRFAALGWTSIVSITLHFLILITRKEEKRRKDKFLYLIHIPALLNMYIFSFSTKISKGQYNLVENRYGWANMTVNNGWDYFYYIYYAIYMVLGLLLLLEWKKRLENKDKIRQVRLIFGSLFAAIVLGSVTDITLSTYLKDPLPQMAPLFILFPTWSMYYSARYYDVINHESLYEEEIIATEEDRKKIFYNIAIAFYLGGLINFLFYYTQSIKSGEQDLSSTIIKSSMFVLTGTLIYLIQKIKNSRLKETLTIMILVANIPIITFSFFDFFATTVWVFPIIIMIASLVFSNRKLLISSTIVTIITQRLMWILKPSGTVLISKYDYILRIILVVIAFVIGHYVNKMYTNKTIENDYQIKFQKINANISSDFITINKENQEEKINRLLKEIALFFEVDRSYVFLINHKENTVKYSYEWGNEGIDIESTTIKKIPLEIIPWWMDELKNNRLVYVEDVNKMPARAKLEQEILIRKNVRSLLALPLYNNDEIEGFIGVESLSLFKRWTDQSVELLNILSNLLSDALTKINSEKEIEFMAYYDSLTKLPNRFLFKARVIKAIDLAKKTDSLISIIFIDLDNFKSVNDTIGHDGGDYLLHEVAKSLQDRVRSTDTVARFGGDEFMIMLDNIEDENDIRSIADDIMRIFSKTFNIYNQEFFITGSAGIAVYPRDGEDPETLIKNADIAMYEAKSKGKNGYAFCTLDMKDEVEKNITISNDLYHALDKGELSVHYQPQLDLNNKKITGLEALLRWKHPKLGMIAPNVFIPIAEKNGLINKIGEWVLKTACYQNKAWQDMDLDHIKIAVNLSAMQFINPHIADDVERVLKETGLDPKYLELEITESMAIEEADYVVEILNKLKKIGISIAIDDFGTEYSSLSRLKVLPIDRIKIDMEFIHGIENNEKDQAITMIIINLAKSLGLNVLAEGVETASQLEFLNQKMCDHVQGYYYYKPMPAEELEKILKEIKIANKVNSDEIIDKLKKSPQSD